ncbi:hypothetical protein HELRODRAFT_180799 [Helobdella robusta]|uniref:Ig-like domain-containing protein n=1 Tax=Helobdella robusta TaxID=6412 RepID=T1FGA6_HELRO|nr:hypothetical protein HELRODRAFT_180799 [Helobdella robusta]ESN93483.1 hypothetical protein HELRODRAFT_180799 [Helobdella robusta]
MEHTKVKLVCQAEGHPSNITQKWTKNGVDVMSGILGQRGVIYADGSLFISSVQDKDMGWYTCAPSNGLDPPRILANPTSSNRLHLTTGTQGRLDCPAEANPPITHVTWSMNERRLEVNERVRMMLQGRSLVIDPVLVRDEGRYSCVPHSNIRSSQSAYTVQVFVRANQRRGIKRVNRATNGVPPCNHVTPRTANHSASDIYIAALSTLSCLKNSFK